jgi:hypothetical protein
MITEEGKAGIDRIRTLFESRKNTANSIATPSEIDWDSYKAKLPDMDVAAMQADYEEFMANHPAVEYDVATDIAAHSASEAAWKKFAAYCTERVAELEALKAESEREALHDGYRVEQALNRLPEFDPAEMKSFADRREWEKGSDDITAAEQAAVREEIASRAGVDLGKFGVH